MCVVQKSLLLVSSVWKHHSSDCEECFMFVIMILKSHVFSLADEEAFNL